MDRFKYDIIVNTIMTQYPETVLGTFNRLKKRFGFRIVLRKLSGHFYVYDAKTWWDKKEKRTRSMQKYIGRIKEDGRFIRKDEYYAEVNLERSKEMLEAHGAVVSFPGKQTTTVTPSKVEEELSEVDKKILMCLSMNARMSISKLAKLVGVGVQTAYNRTKSLEKRFDIKYILEIDVEKLGFIRYLISIKFEENKPKIEELERAFEGEYRIQFAVTTKGEYDVVMYYVDENPLKATDNISELRYKEPLNDYRALWQMGAIAQIFSFMPLRDMFIEHVLKERVWHRTKDTPKIDKNQLRYREFAVLKELNNNSTLDFSDIDKKYNFNKGTSRYTYHSLRERGIIARPTLTMANLGVKYIGMISISNIHYKKIQENRYKFLLDIMEYGKVANRYSLGENIGSPFGAIMFLPITEEGYLDKVADTIEQELQGSVVRSSVVTNVLLGSLCYRRFDSNYSRQYKLLIDFKRIVPQALIQYD